MSGFKLSANSDGADYQSQAVLAYLRDAIGDGIEASWDSSMGYRADIRVTRYDNCREQGYVVFLRDAKHAHQINIAFYEHRNSDDICALLNNTKTFNAPVLSDMTAQMNDKYDVSRSVSHGRANEMGTWIADQLKAFWIEHKD